MPGTKAPAKSKPIFGRSTRVPAVFNFADGEIGDSGDHSYENVLNKMNEDVDFWEYFTQFYADTHGESVDDIRAKFSESETMEAAQIFGFLYEI